MNNVMRNGLFQRLALAALAVALALAAAVGCGGAPVGQEAFRHDVGGEIFVFVEYGDELAVFDGSGRPVSSRQAADAALRSFAWTRALDAADVSGLAQLADRTGELDSDIANARSASNTVVGALDELEGVGASIPFMGRVSAMDLVESAYPGVGALDGAMRGLDSTLNEWGADSDNLSDAAASLQALSVSPRPDADAVESAFERADSAARGLADTIGEIESSLGKAREGVSRLVGALRSASNTPVIGDGLDWLADDIDEEADYALSSLASSLGRLKGDLNAVSTGFGAGAAQAETEYGGYADRWTDSPPDASWPPTDPERRSPPRPDPTPRALASPPTAAPMAAATTPPPAAAAAALPTSTPFAPPTAAPTDDHGDSPSEATVLFANLDNIYASAPMEGDIETPGDVDYFAFSAVGGYLYVIHTTASPSATIELYDSNRSRITENVATYDNEFQWTAKTSDTYYIAVGIHEDGTGNYRAELTSLDARVLDAINTAVAGAGE